MNLQKHIVLIGFMGTGKSTVGTELAKQLAVSFFDTDIEIERKEGTGISGIFAAKGEKYFRQVETDVLTLSINNIMPSVIATGGGIVLSAKNRSLMEDHCLILLDADVEDIFERVKENKDRPLLNSEENLKQTIKKMYDARQEIYNYVAKFRVNTSNKSITQIVAEITAYISGNCIKNGAVVDNKS